MMQRNDSSQRENVKPGCIEIKADCFGETRKVVHLDRQASGRVSFKTWVLLAMGLLIFITGSAFFGYLIYDAGRQKRHQTEVRTFLKEKGLSEAFTPKIVARTELQFGAIGSWCLGLVLLIYGLARTTQESKKNEFTLGSHPKSSFHVPEAFLPRGIYRLPVVRSTGDGYELLLTRKMECEVVLPSGNALTLPQLIEMGMAKQGELPETLAVSLEPGMAAGLVLGNNTFNISWVSSGESLNRGDGRSCRSMAYYGISMAGHALLLFLMLASNPQDTATMEGEVPDSRVARIARRTVRDSQKEATQPEEREEVKERFKKQGLKGERSGRHGRDERLKGKGSGASPDRGRSRSANPGNARNAGIAGLLTRINGPALTSVFGRDAAISQTAENSLQHLVGHVPEDAYAASGMLGSRSGGPSGVGSVGLGTWGTGLPGDGGGLDNGGLAGNRRFRDGYRLPSSKRQKILVPGRVTVETGTVSRELIRRVIQRHRSAIRYCYVSLALAENPGSSGKVTLRFVIDKNGRVISSAVAETTLRHPATERCLVAATRRWQFPRISSIVMVKYPFFFKSSGR